MLKPAATPAASPTPASHGVGPLLRGSGAGRVRWSMYLAFAALLAAVLLYAQATLRLEAMRTADAEILDRAGAQRLLAQQMHDLAFQLVVRGGNNSGQVAALDVLIERSTSDALQIDGLLAKQIAAAPAIRLGVQPVLEAWHGARERLWYHGQLLLDDASAGSPSLLQHRAAVLQADTAPALQSAQALTAALRDAAEQRAQGLVEQVRWGVGLLVLLLLVLSLLVVEPTARAVWRQARRAQEQARELQRLALVAENTSAMVIISDAENCIVWANRAFSDITGWALSESLGQAPAVLLHNPEADPDSLARVGEALARGAGVRELWLHRTRAGADLWLDVDLRPLHDEQGVLTGFVSLSTDVTARMLQQAKLQALWTALPAGVLVQGAGGEIVEANRAGERLLDLSLAQMQARAPRDPGWRILREDGSNYPTADQPAARTLASGEALHNQTVGIRTAQGELRWLLVNTEPQRDAAGHLSGVVSCFTDITESRQLQARLALTARTDTLTQLPNRAVVTERLQRAIDHARRHHGYGFAVLFMDFDRFKQINDTLGHGAGDDMLRQVAERLVHSLRPGDAVARLQAPPDADPMAARLGGDEFVVVLEGVNDAATVGAIAQRVLEELGEPYLIGCTPVQTSVSIGVVLCGAVASQAPGGTTAAPVNTSEEVLRNADTAMYEAKRAGRGRWVMFDDSMHERVVRALAIETDLRQALRQDELFVVYQPVVDLATRRLDGVEALVRWQHPQRGLVSPVEFIGVAEECGLIDAVGALVLRQACTQFMAWQRSLGAAAPAMLAVNLSRAQLEREGLVGEVQQVLNELGMHPNQLQLEVTESLAAQDERVQVALRALKRLGVRLALDDFGTGYSSLACLHQMPVDTVKVDRSFVQHAQTVEYHRVLIEATIRVARTLGMTTVAEGIETEGQAALMLELRCDRGQGYLFSRPLTAASLEAWALAGVAPQVAPA